MKKKIFQFFLSVFLVSIFLAGPVSAQSDAKYWGGKGSGDNVAKSAGLPTNSGGPVAIISNVIAFVLGFLGMVATIMILYAGYLWMSAGGSEDNIKKAKKILEAGVIGLVIILSAYGIASFVIKQSVDVTQNP